jgi:threonine synthase
VKFAGRNIADAGAVMRESCAEALQSGELVDLSTFYEPGRLEGKKTLGFEIAEAFGADLPEAILYPTGGGTGLVGIWKAFGELQQTGDLNPRGALPRMFAIQSENCAPVVEAFKNNFDHVVKVESKGTLADGLDVPAAIMGHEILRILRASKGDAVSVSETAIAGDFKDLGRLGMTGGYESAATVSGLRRALREGRIERKSRVLLIFTSGAEAALARQS